jgi:predicted helicase
LRFGLTIIREAYVEPNIEGFEQAVGEFQERVPELAEGLNEKIKQAHASNKNFQKAFADFFELCQTALNPNIRRDAVDEMLIQHLLTERLFRKIFHDDEFTRRNVVAHRVRSGESDRRAGEQELQPGRVP